MMLLFVPKFIMRAIYAAHIILNGYTTKIYSKEITIIAIIMSELNELHVTRNKPSNTYLELKRLPWG